MRIRQVSCRAYYSIRFYAMMVQIGWSGGHYFMGKKGPNAIWGHEKIHSSINQKIQRLLLGTAVPFLVLIIMLLFSMNNYRRQYASIVGNLAIANEYNLNFKDDMDESLYKLVVGYIDYEHIDSDPTLKDPYALIGELRSEFTNLRNVTTEQESRLWLETLLRNIDTLEKRVDDVLENIRIGGRYDENIEELDNNIYILTELIQEDIQYYIYYQIRSMENVTAVLNRQVQQSVLLCSLLLIIFTAVVLITSHRITSYILHPIQVLHDAMQRVARGDLQVRTAIHSQDELEVLSDGFNSMTGNMQEMILKIKEDEQRVRRLDLRLLQEQINPHFLYNTLDTIVWLIEGGKTDEAEQMVVTLSSFFRMVLSKGKENITVREEEQHIRSYLEIQETRYRDILSYEIDIDPDLHECIIPKLTLQPVVENALYHGIKYKRGKGCIWIHGELDGDDMVLSVRDDGVGMEKEDLEELRREIERPCQETERGFGLANVNERLRMYFGAQYGMRIESEKGNGTLVEIRVPAKQNEE